MNQSKEVGMRPPKKLRANSHVSGILSAALLLLLVGTRLSQAAPGDLVAIVPLPTSPGFGVSVAVDCDGNVYYTQQQPDDPHLYKMNKTGTLLARPIITDSVSGAQLFMDE